ncbi:hypothetical protein HMN09_00858300 [Mycena chlorophos]|uniref:Uncharacterized protein n=1 Tax=Mycena chlorophos TaxID=658473 RepID=A0A8H6STR0_MYCCL|nr:hypothetical protein HMN09_00858300 [Mycena chlorophos]
MQNADTLVPIPRLPLELEREIFELAAWHDKPTMLVLILVASRVRVWIEPLLHRVFHTETKEDIQALHDRLTNNPAHAASLRYLLVTCSTPEVYPALEYILRACSNLVDLGIWVDSKPADDLARLEVTSPRVTHLSLKLEHLAGDLPGHRRRIFAPDLGCFASLTHLDLIDSKPASELGAIMQLLKSPVLPSLRYLAIADAKTEVYLAILALPRPLPLRILCAYGDSVHEDQEAQVPDLRFCVVYSREYTDDWTQAAWRKAGFWELAEGRVADRRAKAAANEADAARRS